MSDSTAKSCEDWTSLTLRRAVGPGVGQVLFSPEFMGDKAVALDFLVRLRDRETSELTGDFCFIQVKGTDTLSHIQENKNGQSVVCIEFKSDHVTLVNRMVVPVYLIAVDATVRGTFNGYICAVNYEKETGFSRIPIAKENKNNIKNEEVLEKLYDEVQSYFDKLRELRSNPNSEITLNSSFFQNDLQEHRNPETRYE